MIRHSRITVIILFFISLLALVLIYGRTREIPQISYQQSPEIGESIVILFPYAITENEALKSFVISPSIEGELQWLEEFSELRFVPKEGFNPSQSYMVTVKKPFSFLTLAQIGSDTAKHSFQPNQLPTGFNARIGGKSLNAAQDDKTTLYYITQSGLKRPITLEVFNSYPGNKEENIRILDEQTLNLYPDNTLISLEHDSKIFKLENGVKKHILNAETFNALGLNWNAIASVNKYELNSYPDGEPLLIRALPHQKAAEGKFIDINLETMKITLWRNGSIVKELPVAGKGNPAVSPTRRGFFTIKLKENNHFSSISHVWMPFSMQYSGDYFIHGWPYWPNGIPLVSKYSGGCVRLYDSGAKEVYNFAEIGTPILIR